MKYTVKTGPDFVTNENNMTVCGKIFSAIQMCDKGDIQKNRQHGDSISIHSFHKIKKVG
jgi:hypothetical protein